MTRPSPKLIALAGGVMSALSVVGLAQQPAAGPPQIEVQGNISWLEKSDVSAIREGVLDKIEFKLGHRVKEGEPIGYLKMKAAELAVAKAQLEAEKTGPITSAKAKKQLAYSELARLLRLERTNAGKGFVSESEREKAEAEVNVADAQIVEATEAQRIAKADLDSAKELLAEHTITAPFTGIIIDRIKNPGESVRANEAVVKLGMTDRLKFIGYVPLDSATKVKVGDLVEVRPIVEFVDLPLEQKRFRGKVMAISREISAIREVTAQVVAEIENPETAPNAAGVMAEVPLDLQLRPGLKAKMTIQLGTASAAPSADPGPAARP